MKPPIATLPRTRLYPSIGETGKRLGEEAADRVQQHFERVPHDRIRIIIADRVSAGIHALREAGHAAGDELGDQRVLDEPSAVILDGVREEGGGGAAKDGKNGGGWGDLGVRKERGMRDGEGETEKKRKIGGDEGVRAGEVAEAGERHEEQVDELLGEEGGEQLRKRGDHRLQLISLLLDDEGGENALARLHGDADHFRMAVVQSREKEGV